MPKRERGEGKGRGRGGGRGRGKPSSTSYRPGWTAPGRWLRKQFLGSCWAEFRGIANRNHAFSQECSALAHVACGGIEGPLQSSSVTPFFHMLILKLLQRPSISILVLPPYIVCYSVSGCLTRFLLAVRNSREEGFILVTLPGGCSPPW